MSSQSKIIPLLEEGYKTAKAFAEPPYLIHYFKQFPDEREADEMAGIKGITENIKALDKPAIAALGPYSSGKTFILSKLIDYVFTSKIEPTTSVITVIRHVEDKPADWAPDHMVFTLKAGADIRSLQSAAVTGSYTIDDLEVLTTYIGNTESDAVVVFLDKPILKECIFFDCPGIGTLSETDFGVDEDGAPMMAADKAHRLVREQSLQQMAVSSADAYLVLSALLGPGAFADSATSTVLYSIARKKRQVAPKTPFGNLLFVGSQADPDRQGLERQDEVIAMLQHNIEKQINKLPHDLRRKFDINISERIVLFYALDETQVEREVRKLVNSIRRGMQTAPMERIVEEAENQFAEVRGDSERLHAFKAAFSTMVDQLRSTQEEYRQRTSEAALQAGIGYYIDKSSKYTARSKNKVAYEKLSRQYEVEQQDREKAWACIVDAAKPDILAAEATSVAAFRRTYTHWTDKANLQGLLDDNYGSGDRKGASEFMATILNDTINGELQTILTTQIDIVERKTAARLEAFDQKWIDRAIDLMDDEEAGQSGDLAVRAFDIGRVESFSAADAFKGVLAGVAGGTTLAAFAGSVLAQAAFVKVLALGVGALSAVGAGLPAFAILAVIPVWGWLAAGVASLGYAIIKFVDWKGSLIANIRRDLKKKRAEALAAAAKGIHNIMTSAGDTLEASLEKTGTRLQAHIHEVHQNGKGLVTSEDLQQAASFYDRHVAVLRDTLATVREID